MDEKTKELIAIGAQVQKGGMSAMQRFIEKSFDANRMPTRKPYRAPA